MKTIMWWLLSGAILLTAGWIGPSTAFFLRYNNHGPPSRLNTLYEVNLNASSSSNNSLELNFNSNYTVSDTSIDDGTHKQRLDHLRVRKKMERLQFIQSQILERLGSPRKPNASIALFSEEERKRIMDKFELFQKQNHVNEVKTTEEVYAERVQSFYPSCSLPRNTEKELWEDADSFHIYYDVSLPRHMQGTAINVSSAKLRLYKTNPFSNATDSHYEECRHQQQRLNQSHHDGLNVDDEKFRISVFQFVKSLRSKGPRGRRRKNEGIAKKKLLESKMVVSHYEGWIEFNVRSSLREWLLNPNKNYGLEVVVENAYEVPLNPTCYFQNMNCSVAKNASAMEENASSLFENETYPTLDLHTIEYQQHSEEVIVPSPKNESSERRTRRNVPYYTSCDYKKSCCHESTYVTFKDLGWDKWIIEPEGFHLGYCVGTCSDADLGNDIVVNDSAEDESCVPDQTSPMNLIYFEDDGEIYFGTVRDFLVESCKCA